jgi:hypothetical protein
MGCFIYGFIGISMKGVHHIIHSKYPAWLAVHRVEIDPDAETEWIQQHFQMAKGNLILKCDEMQMGNRKFGSQDIMPGFCIALLIEKVSILYSVKHDLNFLSCSRATRVAP